MYLCTYAKTNIPINMPENTLSPSISISCAGALSNRQNANETRPADPFKKPDQSNSGDLLAVSGAGRSTS